jgi:hypothetical protein
MHVESDEGSSDIEIVGVYMPSASCVGKAEHEVSLLSDVILGVIVHVNVCVSRLNVILGVFAEL